MCTSCCPSEDRYFQTQIREGVIHVARSLREAGLIRRILSALRYFVLDVEWEGNMDAPWWEIGDSGEQDTRAIKHILPIVSLLAMMLRKDHFSIKELPCELSLEQPR